MLDITLAISEDCYFSNITESLYTLIDNGNKILVSYEIFVNSIKNKVNIVNHDTVITAIQSKFTIRNKCETLIGQTQIDCLGIVIDRTHGNSNVPMVSFNIVALNNEYFIWNGY